MKKETTLTSIRTPSDSFWLKSSEWRTSTIETKSGVPFETPEFRDPARLPSFSSSATERIIPLYSWTLRHT